MNETTSKKSPLSRTFDILRHSIVQNIIALFGLQVACYLLPLVTIPYLAWILGPATWGLLAMTQSFAGYLIIIIEYGFILSGTREVARRRESREKLSVLLSGVMGAKCVLALACIVATILAYYLVPVFQQMPLLLWAACIWTVGQGMSLVWFFQGLERMKAVAILDVSVKVLATAGIFIWVREPNHAWRVLCLYAAASFLSLGRWFDSGLPRGQGPAPHLGRYLGCPAHGPEHVRISERGEPVHGGQRLHSGPLRAHPHRGLVRRGGEDRPGFRGDSSDRSPRRCIHGSASWSGMRAPGRRDWPFWAWE